MEGYSTRACCDDCYFRRAELCALRLDEPCPTFRPYTTALSRSRNLFGPRPVPSPTSFAPS